jgi:hypothetical protein
MKLLPLLGIAYAQEHWLDSAFIDIDEAVEPGNRTIQEIDRKFNN